MKTATQSILAMAPGKREFGIAVFDEGELIYFAVRSLQSRQSEKLLKSEVNDLVQEFITFSKPQTIAVKAISQYQKTSPSLRLIVKIIKRQAALNRIPMVEISLGQIKAALCVDNKTTQKKAFQNLTVTYPELCRHSNRPSRWQTEYYHNLLSAVAVGVVFFKSLSESES